MTCPSCGAPCNAGDTFCINCGTPLSAPAPAQASGMFSGDHTVLVGGPNVVSAPTTCPVCGQPVMPNSDFCTSCGTRLTAPAAQPAAVPPTQPTPGMPPAGSAQGMGSAGSGDHTVLVGGSNAASTPSVCPACGAPLNPGDAFCTTCGTAVGAAPASAPAYGQQGPASAPAYNQTPAMPAYGGGAQAYSAGAPAAAYGQQNAVPAQIKEEAPITSRPQLMLLTREEARNGCTKTIEVGGQMYSVDVPAGVTEDTVLDLPGIGYFDTDTGVRGSVRVTFFID